MAEVVWPERVTEQIAEIIAYIRCDNPIAADGIGDRLFALGESLAEFPDRGRPGPNRTREMTTVWPYVLRYRLRGDIVTILHVRHGRRRPLR